MAYKVKIFALFLFILSSHSCKKMVGTLEDAQNKLGDYKAKQDEKDASDEAKRQDKFNKIQTGETKPGSLGDNPFTATLIAQKIEEYKKTVPQPSDMVKDSHYAHFGELYYLSDKANAVVPDENSYWNDFFSKVVKIDNKIAVLEGTSEKDYENKFKDFQKTFSSLMSEESVNHNLDRYVALLSAMPAAVNDPQKNVLFTADQAGSPLEFNAASVTFNSSNAIIFALMNRKIEKEVELFSKQLEEWQFSSSTSFTLESENPSKPEDSDGKVFVATKGKQYFVLCKGSQTKRDWQSNMRSRLVEASDTYFSKGKVHQGFYQTVENFWTKLGPALKEVPNDQFVWFTGHSRGGALALLSALKHVKNGGKAILYTYGQPRAVDDDFVSAVQALPDEEKVRFKYFRIQAADDMVPYVPPSSASSEAMKQLNLPFNIFRDKLSSYPVEDLLDVLGVKK